MIGPSGPVRVYLACGVTDMRKGMDGLAAQVQTMLRLIRMAGRSTRSGGAAVTG